jgi:hypothetical protein
LGFSDKEFEEQYAFYNKLNPLKEGVSKDDLKIGMVISCEA